MTKQLTLSVMRSTPKISLKISSRESAEYYDGEYDVTPMVRQEKVLYTRDKTMRRNMKILEIPYYETSNPNGTTVYIGE